MLRVPARAARSGALALAILAAPAIARAFWVLGFSTAQTVDPGHAAFIGGTGGQVTWVGRPTATSYTPFLAHAGIRVGLADGLDVGYRMVSVPLPFNSAGPTLGAAVDLKLRLTPREAAWQVAVVGGGAYAYLAIDRQDRTAWSPGAALLLSRDLARGLTLTANARYLFAAIPSAPGGTPANHVHAAGGSLSLRVALGPGLAIVPEVGLFRVVGVLRAGPADGYASQYGAVLAAAL